MLKRNQLSLGLLVIGLVSSEATGATVRPTLVSTMDGALMVAPDGSLWTWGGSPHSRATWFGDRRASEVPQPIGKDRNWRQLSASFMTVLALKVDGSIWGWGWEYSGNKSRADGLTFVASPTRIGSSVGWAKIAVGAGHSLAIKNDGSLWSWGRNDHGQLGDGSTNNQATPTRIGHETDWQSLAAGAFTSFGLAQNGTIWGWGEGLGSTEAHDGSFAIKDEIKPSQIDSGTNWSAIAAGDFFLLALRADGTLWIGGRNSHSIVSNPSAPSFSAGLFRVGEGSGWTEIYAGESSFFARKRDGRWFACGHNFCEQLGLAKQGRITTLERVFVDADCWAFATGCGNSLLLAGNGTLLTWGKRLGSDQSATSIAIKDDLNLILGRLSQRLPLFDAGRFKTDSSPCKIWELPSKMPRKRAAVAR